MNYLYEKTSNNDNQILLISLVKIKIFIENIDKELSENIFQNKKICDSIEELKKYRTSFYYYLENKLSFNDFEQKNEIEKLLLFIIDFIDNKSIYYFTEIKYIYFKYYRIEESIFGNIVQCIHKYLNNISNFNIDELFIIFKKLFNEFIKYLSLSKDANDETKKYIKNIIYHINDRIFHLYIVFSLFFQNKFEIEILNFLNLLKDFMNIINQYNG